MVALCASVGAASHGGPERSPPPARMTRPVEYPGEVFCGIYGYGFEKPFEIQQRAVLPIITTCSSFHFSLSPPATGALRAFLLVSGGCICSFTSVRIICAAGAGARETARLSRTMSRAARGSLPLLACLVFEKMPRPAEGGEDGVNRGGTKQGRRHVEQAASRARRHLSILLRLP